MAIMSLKLSSKLLRILACFKANRTFSPSVCQGRHLATTSIAGAKFISSSKEALEDIQSDAQILVGGNGLCGAPENLLQALSDLKIEGLTIVTHDGEEKFGSLLRNKQIKRMILSVIGKNEDLKTLYKSGGLEIELTSPGILAERIRAGGAGIAAFFSPTGLGTPLQTGGVPTRYNADGSVAEYSEAKPTQEFAGRGECVMEGAIKADYALIKAWRADRQGNLVFRKTARNYNSIMCKAAKVTIAEVEEIVETGSISAEDVHVPSVYVHRVVKGEKYEKKIEKLRLAKEENLSPTTEKIARRAALEFKDGIHVNVSAGISWATRDFVPKGIKVYVHSESGILGMGQFPREGEVDPDLVSSWRDTVTAEPGASFFSTGDSCNMARGGHVDLVMFTAAEVSQFGDVSSTLLFPGKEKAFPATMDFISSPRNKIVVVMEHTAKDGTPKIVETCSLPLIGKGVVDLIITELAVFEVDPEKGLTLVEAADGYLIDDIAKATGCKFQVAPNLKPMAQVEKL